MRLCANKYYTSQHSLRQARL